MSCFHPVDTADDAADTQYVDHCYQTDRCQVSQEIVVVGILVYVMKPDSMDDKHDYFLPVACVKACSIISTR
jgi:hypothetical protein